MPTLARYKDTVALLGEIPARDFKNDFLEYLVTNQFDVGWEGFQQRDLHGFAKVLRDFILAQNAGGLATNRVSCKVCGGIYQKRGIAMHVMRTHHMNMRDYQGYTT